MRASRRASSQQSQQFRLHLVGPGKQRSFPRALSTSKQTSRVLMAYRANPFLQRMSEQSTSDQEFAQMFSPKLLDLIDDKAFEGAVHVFRSPPGGGKTTLLRAL